LTGRRRGSSAAANKGNIMKAKKPNWTPLELYAICEREDELEYETRNHSEDCDCNLCMELFSLDKLLRTFSEDKMAGSVIEYRKAQEAKQ
jgi:hypothetical protein